jgi:hypothetical protein
MAEVQFLAGERDFSSLNSFKTGSETHPAFYPIDIRGSFHGDKAARA